MKKNKEFAPCRVRVDKKTAKSISSRFNGVGLKKTEVASMADINKCWVFQLVNGMDGTVRASGRIALAIAALAAERRAKIMPSGIMFEEQLNFLREYRRGDASYSCFEVESSNVSKRISGKEGLDSSVPHLTPGNIRLN